MPKITISQSESEMARLQRLAKLWGVKPSRAIAWAVIHALESVERGEGVRTVVRSEHDDDLPDLSETVAK